MLILSLTACLTFSSLTEQSACSVCQSRLVPVAACAISKDQRIQCQHVEFAPQALKIPSRDKSGLHWLCIDPNHVIGRRLRKDLNEGELFLTIDFYLESGQPR